jgi:hypothetical protein
VEVLSRLKGDALPTRVRLCDARFGTDCAGFVSALKVGDVVAVAFHTMAEDASLLVAWAQMSGGLPVLRRP